MLRAAYPVSLAAKKSATSEACSTQLFRQTCSSVLSLYTSDTRSAPGAGQLRTSIQQQTCAWSPQQGSSSSKAVSAGFSMRFDNFQAVRGIRPPAHLQVIPILTMTACILDIFPAKKRRLPAIIVSWKLAEEI